MANPSPNHAVFILVIVVAILAIPSLLPEDLASFIPSFQELHPFIVLAPVVLLLVVRFLASTPGPGLGIDTDASTIHRVSGSSVGLAALLVIVLAMIWYQSMLQ